MKRLLTIVLAGLSLAARAQSTLSLDSCMLMAERSNLQLAIGAEKVRRAKAEAQAARTNYLPKVSLAAGYMRSGREVQLLSDGQINTLNNVGTATATQLGNMAQQIVAQHPDLAALVQGIGAYLPQLAEQGNALGHTITDAFHTDTRNMTVGTVLLTQPLYMGGKIRAYDRITRRQGELAESQLEAARRDLRLDVERTYWQIASLAGKKRLATQYRDMLKQLQGDVQKMHAEGLATKASCLQVDVKLNEAEMALTKVDDALTLLRMVLCRLCGLPLDSRPVLADEGEASVAHDTTSVQPDAALALAQRPEMQQLSLAEQMLDDKVRITRSDMLPQLALTGGYLLSNPSVFNSFERKFKGTWGVGVMLKMPVWNWGETRYKVRAAKSDAAIARLETADARNKITLQVTQEAFRVNEAVQRLTLSLRSMDTAAENLRTASLGFTEGVITTTDLLQAQTAWLQAHNDVIDARIETRLARAAYHHALGEK
ncbi:MAG: TolC family protein [Bacteroidales bacterium]|nr:TolC family protein [Bacteroidales bacterium]